MYNFLDKFFLTLHSIIILLNLFGWIWQSTRKLNFILLFLTGFSWTILGIWFGFGYCPLTELHWNVLKKLGQVELPDSYIKYLIDRITGLNINADLIEYLTIIGFIIAFTCSSIVNWKDYKKKKNL